VRGIIRPAAVLGAAVAAVTVWAAITGTVNLGYTSTGHPAPVAAGQSSRPAGPPGPPTAKVVPASPAAAAGTLPRQLIVPDLIVVTPAGITATQLEGIAALPGVRAVLAAGGGRVAINGQPAGILAVPAAFRSWTPPVTAADTPLWTGLAAGQLITSPAAAARLRLTPRATCRITAADRAQVRFGAAALLGMPGVDAIISTGQAARLGLTPDTVVLVNAPAADLAALLAQVRSVIGTAGTVASLVPVVTVTSLPVDTAEPAGRPENWLQLYQDSAAGWCPGLSWTVLAAIGEIESGDGSNDGPSTAGALGPMQFLPATWQAWGIDGYGPPGPPDITNPLDAVPSAARMLCADGAASPATLTAAIFDYNHATWYVTEVLDLASEYAREYT
jgi:hypothetical protein